MYSKESQLKDDEKLNYSFEIRKNKLLKAFKKYSILPVCFEKCLIKCLLAFGVRIYKSLDELKQFTEINKSDIIEECKLMKQRVEIEGIKSFIDFNKIDHIADKFCSGYWDSGIDASFDVYKAYQVLDIEKIRELYEKTNNEAAIIRDEDIILVLGPTGCGKSTIISFLMGSVMEKTVVEGLNHIRAKENLEYPDVLNKIESSPYPFSKTNCLVAVGLKNSIMKSSDKGQTFFCDTPGFGDTNGCEVDIINSIGVIEGIKKCKSVRLLIIISYHDAFSHRMRGLASLSHILSDMIHNITNFQGMFKFLFTHFPDDTRNELKPRIEYLINEERLHNNDPCFLFFLEELLSELQFEGSTKFIDPLSSNRIVILKDLYKANKLGSPDEHFKCSFDDQSKDKLKEQIYQHQLVINSCLKHQDYDLVRFKLSELEFLKNKIDLDFVKKMYEATKTTVKTSINEAFNSAIMNLKESISTTNVIQTKTTETFKIQRNFAKGSTDSMSKKFGFDDVVISEAFSKCLADIYDELLKQIKERELDDDLLKVNLDQLFQLKQNFEEISYNVDGLYNKLERCEKTFISSIEEQNFKSSSTQLRLVKTAQVLLKEHLDVSRVQDTYNRMFDRLMNYLNSLIVGIENIFKKLNIVEDEKIVLKSNLQVLDLCRKNFSDFEDTKECIGKIYEDFISKMLGNLEKTHKKLQEQFDGKSNFHDFVQIEETFESMTILFNISDDLKQRGARYYYSILDIVFGYINELRRDIENDIEKIQYDKDNTITYKKLYDRIKSLEEIKWIDKYKPGAYSNVRSSIQNFVLNEVRLSKEKIEKMSFDLENFENVKEGNKLLSKMIESEKIADYIPEIKELINAAVKVTLNGTKTVLDHIQKMTEYKPDDINLRTWELAISYLMACKDSPLASHKDKTEVNFKVEKYMKDYQVHLEKQLNLIFTKMECDDADTELSNHIQKLYNLYKVVFDISNYPILSEILFTGSRITNNISRKYEKRLVKYLNDFEEEINKDRFVNNQKRLVSKLGKLKLMFCLDEFIKNESDAFRKLHKKTYQYQIESAQNMVKSFEEFLNKHEYFQAEKIISGLENVEDIICKDCFNKCKDLLKRMVNKLRDETRNSAIKFLYSQEINNNDTILSLIVRDLNSIEQIKLLLEPFIESCGNEKSLSSIKLDVLKRIDEGFIEQLNEIKVVLKNYNFPKATKLVNYFKLKIEILDKYCSENILNNLKQIEYQIQNGPKEIVEKFKRRSIDDYRFNSPKELIDKLKVDHSYTNTIHEINEIVYNKFKKEIDDICSIKRSNTVNNIKQFLFRNDASSLHKRIRNLEKVANITYLPENLLSRINDDIDDLKDDINKEKERNYEFKLANEVIEPDVFLKSRNKISKESLNQILKFLKDVSSKLLDAMFQLAESSRLNKRDILLGLCLILIICFLVSKSVFIKLIFMVIFWLILVAAILYLLSISI